MDDNLRACYGVLLLVAVLSPYMTATRVPVTLPMCFSLVYVAVWLSYHTTCQQKSDKLEDTVTGSSSDADKSAIQNDYEDDESGATEEDEDDDEEEGERQPSMVFLVCTALVSLFLGSPIITGVFAIDLADALVGHALVLLNLCCLMCAFGPFVLDVLRCAADGRLTKQQLKLQLRDGVEWSWLWVATFAMALVVSITTVCTEHLILKHLFGFAVVITSVATMSRGNALLLNLLAMAKTDEDASNRTFVEKVAADVMTFSLPLEAEKDASKEHGVTIHLVDILIAGWLMSCIMRMEFSEARSRGKLVRVDPFDKPMCRTALIFYVIGFAVGEIDAYVSGIPRWSPRYAMMPSLVLVGFLLVKRGHVRDWYELGRGVFVGPFSMFWSPYGIFGAPEEIDVSVEASTKANLEASVEKKSS